MPEHDGSGEVLGFDRRWCHICMEPAEPHHIILRSVGGCECEVNKINMCRIHHDEWHSQGLEFVMKHNLERKVHAAKAHRIEKRRGGATCRQGN